MVDTANPRPITTDKLPNFRTFSPKDARFFVAALGGPYRGTARSGVEVFQLRLEHLPRPVKPRFDSGCRIGVFASPLKVRPLPT